MANYTAEILPNDRYNEWDSIVDNCLNATIFNKSSYIKPICDNFGYQFEICICKDQDNKIVGGIAYGYQNKMGIKLIKALPFTVSNNVIVLDKKQKYLTKLIPYRFSVVTEILNFLNKKFDYIEIVLPTTEIDCRPYTWNNYNAVVNYTYEFELGTIEEDFNNFDPDLKRRIKKGQKLEYEFWKSTEKSEIELFVNGYLKTIDRKNIHAHFNKTQLSTLLDTLLEKSNVTFYFIKYENDIVSSSFVVRDGDKLYYLMANNNPEYYKTELSNVFVYTILKELENDGVKTFDFVGANTETVAGYKANYTFCLTPYQKVYKINSLKYKLFDQVKTLYKKVK